MAEDKKILLDIQINYAQIAKQTTDVKNKLEVLNATYKKLKVDAENALANGQVQQYQAIQEEITKTESELRVYNGELKNLAKTSDLMTKANKAQAGSYEQLLRQQQLAQTNLKLLEGTLKQNADGTFELTDEYKKAAEQVRVAKDALIAFDQGIKDGRTNVGNYSDSFKEAIASSGIFKGKIGEVREAIYSANSSVEAFKNGIKVAKDGLSQSVTVVNDAYGALNTFTSTLKDIPTTGGKVQAVLKGVGSSGVSVFRAIASAVAATGIGLLVIALGLVFNYLRQVDPLVEKFEQGFAAVGAVVDVLGKSLVEFFTFLTTAFTNFDQFISKLSFANIKKGLSDTADEAKRAALAAADLTKRQQELEDLERDSILTKQQLSLEAQKARKAADDKTKSDKERIALIEQATQKEREALAIEVNLSKQRLQLINDEVAEKIKAGTISDELRQKQVDAEVEFNQLQADLNNKDLDASAETAKIKNSLYQEALAARLTLLNEEKRNLEIFGKDTTEIQKRIAQEELNGVLNDTTKGFEAKKAARAKYNNDILAIDQKFAEDQRKLIEQQQDAALELILDGEQKEIAAAALAGQRKIDQIKGDSEVEKQLRQTIAEQTAQKILEIKQKYADIETADSIKIIQNNADLLTAEAARQYSKEEEALKIALSRKELTQEEYNKRLLQIQLRRQQQELDIILSQTGFIQAAQKKALDDNLKNIEDAKQKELDALKEKQTTGIITEQQYNDTKEQINNRYLGNVKVAQDAYNVQEEETAKTQGDKINTITQQVKDTQTQIVVTTNQQQIDDEKKKQDLIYQLQQAGLQSLGGTLNALGALIAEDEKSRKDNANVLKAISAGEATVNYGLELSAISKANAASPQNVATGGVWASVKTPLDILSATLRYAIALGKINSAKFADGGFTDIINRFNPTNAGTFASGGNVNSPTIGLIGEAGAEYVAPNWQIQQAPQLFSSLENWRRTGVMQMPQFAEGGLTAVSNFSSGMTSQNVLSGLSMEGLGKAVAAALQESPPIVSVQDIISETTKSVTVKNGANI